MHVALVHTMHIMIIGKEAAFKIIQKSFLAPVKVKQ